MAQDLSNVLVDAGTAIASFPRQQMGINAHLNVPDATA
jgi:hypothetical protein